MVAAALASCMLTFIGVVAERRGINIEGTEIETEKVMYAEPRRIGEINMVITFPNKLDDKTMDVIKKAVLTCPVYKTLHPDTVKGILYKFGNDAKNSW